jgi:hypothetical protein
MIERWLRGLAIALPLACNDGGGSADAEASTDTGVDASAGSTSNGDGTSSTTGLDESGSTGAPEPEIGTVESFAVVGVGNEGLAFAPGPDGEPTLYVGLSQDHAVVRVAPDGAVTMHAEVPGALGVAATSDGALVVCGLASLDAGAPAVIWRVTSAGDASILVESTDPALALTNFVAVASDDSLVFTDSEGNAVYRADADGTALELVTDAITYPNGLAFADGRLYVASYDSDSLWVLEPGPTGFGAPELVTDMIPTLDGIAVAEDGSFYLMTTLGGVQRLDMGVVTTIADAMQFNVVANGAFAADGYGDGWLYVTNLFGDEIARVWVGVAGSPS